MRIFVTGASGWIGSPTVAELLRAGHQVVGLARSEASAARVAALGAEVRRGDLTDLDGLHAAAADSDGVLHLGYDHASFSPSGIAAAAAMDRATIDTFGDALAGTGKALVIASGVIGIVHGRAATEHDLPEDGPHPRIANAAATLALADRGVRSAVVRLAPTVHGRGDRGFVATLVDIARRGGVSGYPGDGSNRWPAVHVLDTAVLLRLIVERATPGSVWHAIADEGIPTKEIAEAIGRAADLPVKEVPAEQFEWLSTFFAMDLPITSEYTRRTLGWTPTHPGLIEDLDAGAYTS